MEKPSKEPSVWTKKIGGLTFSSDKEPTNLSALVIVLGILLLSFPLISILERGVGMGFDSYLDEEIILPMLMLFIPCIILGIFALTLPKKIRAEYDEFMKFVEKEHAKERREYERWEKEHPHWGAEEFYRQMRSAGFTSVETDTQKEKLRLYVKNKGMKLESGYKSWVDYFNLGKSEVERIENKARISALKRKEKEDEKNLLKYANLVGREKSTKYCKDRISECKKKIAQCESDEEKVKRGGEATYNLGKQKEHDWAVHGGIASGIAGGAAGVATAYSIQSKNAEIRENNQNLAKATAQLTVFQLDKIWKVKREAEENLAFWKKELEECKLKLVRMETAESLIEKLQIRVKNYTVTESGAVRLKIGCKCKEKQYINNDLEAAIDGEIKVIIKSSGKALGTCACVFNYEGVSTYEHTIEAICLGAKANNKELTFEFEPTNLWLIEN